MSYHGVKFKTEITEKEVPKDLRVKELIYWCQEFHNYNLAPPYKGGSYGNLSFRLRKNEDSFVITGSKVGLKDELCQDSFVKVSSCDLEKRIVYALGMREPSSESMLHFVIYQKREDVGAIFHGHCQEILSCADKLGVPETTREEDYGTAELVQRVLEILNDETFLIIKNHGFISLGRTMEEAGKLALEMYNKCV